MNFLKTIPEGYLSLIMGLIFSILRFFTLRYGLKNLKSGKYHISNIKGNPITFGLVLLFIGILCLFNSLKILLK